MPPAADAPLLHLTVLSPRARGASSVHACGDGTPDAGPELLGSLCFIFIRKQKLGKRGEGGDGERPPCSATASGVRRERAVHLPVPRTVRHPSVLLMTHGLGRHLVSESCQASISTQPTLGTVSVSEPGKHRLPLTCGDKSRVKSRVNTETPIPAAPAAAPGTKGASTSSRGLPHRLWGRMSDAAPNSRSRLSCPVRRGPRHQAHGVVRPPPTPSLLSQPRASWVALSAQEQPRKRAEVYVGIFKIIHQNQPTSTRYLTVSKATENRADWPRFSCVRAVRLYRTPARLWASASSSAAATTDPPHR